MRFTKHKKHLKFAWITGLCITFIFAIQKNNPVDCDLEAIHGDVSSIDVKCKQRLYASLEIRPSNKINCSRILRGDEEAINTAVLDRLLVANRHIPFTEDQYINVTTDCVTYKKIRKFIPFSLSREEEAFPIAYSMVIHENIEMFERLLRSIYTPHNIYCVHVDEKSPENFKTAVKGITSCFDNVFVASKLEKVVYASWSRVQGDLNCMEDLLRSHVEWKYLLNTCGTDFPIKTNAESVKALQLLKGMNNMESQPPSPYKKKRWLFQYKVGLRISKTEISKEPPPDNITMFAGNAYNVMTKDFVRTVLTDPKVRRLMEWSKDTHSPDEHLWATLHRMHGIPGSVPSLSEFDTSDLQAIARLVKWGRVGEVSCNGIYRRGICVYGTGNLPWMVQQHHLLANKFDPSVDNNAIQCLEEYLRHKTLYGTDL
ncbi:beta-1,3-galactosyl-O-glycosyl-glycoprotein beta-1,6-N-acetylglucosaminyltransferase 3-like [Rana temporaria]|uniref:beta-1,3-galactosyl-O-glycosyl-glycoprotein beta-1,6-N-acetylglucosaminyltransferase 3-like n=1 Tax=Rana temporaria TaxID=8407 RepID=UPI001AAC7699|nr:beta-1,3-galactosyl-O-glycosyl-glycoprotein beta-1,6-N-acetylglucosaminyltransferase 3-like [Rana temporaria]